MPNDNQSMSAFKHDDSDSFPFMSSIPVSRFNFEGNKTPDQLGSGESTSVHLLRKTKSGEKIKRTSKTPANALNKMQMSKKRKSSKDFSNMVGNLFRAKNPSIFKYERKNEGNTPNSAQVIKHLTSEELANTGTPMSRALNKESGETSKELKLQQFSESSGSSVVLSDHPPL
jgi:hypothetical protein